MSASIETKGSKAAFVSAHTSAWHQLGTTLPDCFTAEEAMRIGHLGGWNVRKAPLYVELEGGKSLAVPDAFGVLRDNPFTPGQVDVLGHVGKAYVPVQNEAHAEFLNTLVDEGGAHFDTAGSLDGGKRVFLTMALPGHIKIGGIDPVDMYLAAVNSHDGSLAFTIMVTPIRVVCANTLNAAFANHSHIVRIRHTTNANKNITRARETLELSFEYLDAFQMEAEQMIQTTLTEDRFAEIVTAEFGPAEDASQAVQTRWDARLGEWLDLFSCADTQKEIRGTAWAGFNALTEWSDHFAPVRGGDDDNRRAERSVFDSRFADRARELMMALV